MLRSRLEARVGRVEDWGWSTVHNYRHGFEKLGGDGTGKGTIAPHPARQVHGVLYAITDQQWRVLDHYEGGYRDLRLEVLHQSAGARLRAVSYTAIAPVGPLRPTAEYVDYYRRGMREHGLPEDYVRHILADHA